MSRPKPTCRAQILRIDTFGTMLCVCILVNCVYLVGAGVQALRLYSVYIVGAGVQALRLYSVYIVGAGVQGIAFV